jgi:hypothetical protein
LTNLSVEEISQLNYELNIHIEKEEIHKCIKKHKNNKASGEDIIINEYIEATSDQFIVVYEKFSILYLNRELFQKVFVKNSNSFCNEIFQKLILRYLKIFRSSY